MNIDELWLEISGKDFLSDTKRLVCCVYRHPSQKNLEQFLDELNNCLININSKSKILYIVGDININTLYNTHQPNITQKYDLILKCNGCRSIITKPTRTIKHSQTSIDHIITNDTVPEITPGVIDYFISDHSFIFAFLYFNNKKYNIRQPSESAKLRNFVNFNV